MTLCRIECGTLVDFLEAICMGQGNYIEAMHRCTED